MPWMMVMVFPNLSSLEHAVLRGHWPAMGLEQVPQIPGGGLSSPGRGRVAGWEYLGQQLSINECFHNNISMFYNIGCTGACQPGTSPAPFLFLSVLCSQHPSQTQGHTSLFFHAGTLLQALAPTSKSVLIITTVGRRRTSLLFPGPSLLGQPLGSALYLDYLI